MLNAPGRSAGAGQGGKRGDGSVAAAHAASPASARRRRPPTVRAALADGGGSSSSSPGRRRRGSTIAGTPVREEKGQQKQDDDDDNPGGMRRRTAPPPPPSRQPQHQPQKSWRRELAHLAPLLRDRTRPWALPLVLSLCYERNAPPSRSAYRALGCAQWSELLARRAAAERAVAAAAHATAAAHARLVLLRRFVGLEEGGDDEAAAGKSGRGPAAAAATTPATNTTPTSTLPRRWLTAQEADKERTTLSEARKAAERALKALAAASALAEEAAGDGDFASRRAARMAALARGLVAHGAWLQRRALRDVLAAGRRNEIEVEAARALLGGGGQQVVVEEGDEEEAGGGREEEEEEDEATRPQHRHFPPLPGLLAAYHSVALSCFDCYSDPSLERRAPGPGLPSSTGRRFPRLVPRRALFPAPSDAGGGHAPSAYNKRRLAAARRILAWVDDDAAEGGGGPLPPLAEVEVALAEGSYGVGGEPLLPPMDVLLERAVALERRIEAAAGQKRGRGGGGSMPAVAPAAAPTPAPPPPVARGWKTDAWSGDGGG